MICRFLGPLRRHTHSFIPPRAIEVVIVVVSLAHLGISNLPGKTATNEAWGTCRSKRSRDEDTQQWSQTFIADHGIHHCWFGGRLHSWNSLEKPCVTITYPFYLKRRDTGIQKNWHQIAMWFMQSPLAFHHPTWPIEAKVQLSMMSLVEQSKTVLPVSSVALRHTIDLKPEIPKPEIPVMTHTFVPINAHCYFAILLWSTFPTSSIFQCLGYSRVQYMYIWPRMPKTPPHP